MDKFLKTLKTQSKVYSLLWQKITCSREVQFLMLRSEIGAAHTPHEGEDGVFRSYSILANTVTPLCTPVSPYHFKDLLIWKEPSKGQLQGPGWHHQEKLGHGDHGVPCESQSCLLMFCDYEMTSSNAWEPRLSSGDSVKSAWCSPVSIGHVLFMYPKQFEVYIKKEKDHCPGGVHRHFHEANMFEQSCEAWSSEKKNISLKQWKKIQFRDYLTENWIYCSWYKILNFQK